MFRKLVASQVFATAIKPSAHAFTSSEVVFRRFLVTKLLHNQRAWHNLREKVMLKTTLLSFDDRMQVQKIVQSLSREDHLLNDTAQLALTDNAPDQLIQFYNIYMHLTEGANSNATRKKIFDELVKSDYDMPSFLSLLDRFKKNNLLDRRTFDQLVKLLAPANSLRLSSCKIINLLLQLTSPLSVLWPIIQGKLELIPMILKLENMELEVSVICKFIAHFVEFNTYQCVGKTIRILEYANHRDQKEIIDSFCMVKTWLIDNIIDDVYEQISRPINHNADAEWVLDVMQKALARARYRNVVSETNENRAASPSFAGGRSGEDG